MSGEECLKQGRGRPKGSKNKIEKYKPKKAKVYERKVRKDISIKPSTWAMVQMKAFEHDMSVSAYITRLIRINCNKEES